MPEKQLPGAWPDSPVMGDSLAELCTPPRPALRIVVPPTEYCPFSTDLTLPVTPLSLPTPISSSCFTFSDTQLNLVGQSVPPTPAPLSCAQDTIVNLASPTSSQFLLMPPATPVETATGMPSAARDESKLRAKSANPRPWEASSTWLTDLGGHTETDRIFRHNLRLDIVSVDTDSSPASTPALSQSALSPSSQVSSVLAYNSPTTPAKSPVSLPLLPSPYTSSMSPQSSPARLALKPTGTDTFPSTLDSLEAWRESIAPGIPQPEEPHLPLSAEVHSSQLAGLMTETAVCPGPPSHPFSRAPRLSKSQTLMKHAKMIGGRVKQLVTRQGIHSHRGSMDRGVSFRVVTSQDSENGSVILITAPPPPYDDSSFPYCPVGQRRSRTTSAYSSAVQTTVAEHPTVDMAELGSRQEGSNRSALRRLSIAALSTIKRI